MKQRETIFCEDYIDKIFPDKHRVRRDARRISLNTGIDFNKSIESPPPKNNPKSKLTRNLETSMDMGVKESPNKKAKGSFHRDFLSQSYIDNTYGMPASKKHIPKTDNIKSLPPQIINTDILRYSNPQRRETINKYMGSSQIKDLFNMDNRSYYRGVLEYK